MIISVIASKVLMLVFPELTDWFSCSLRSPNLWRASKTADLWLRLSNWTPKAAARWDLIIWFQIFHNSRLFLLSNNTQKYPKISNFVKHGIKWFSRRNLAKKLTNSISSGISIALARSSNFVPLSKCGPPPIEEPGTGQGGYRG